jgi:hypothetical protein
VPAARTVPDPETPRADALAMKVGKARLRRALRRGLKVAVRVPSAGRLSGSARRGRKAVASGRRRAKAGGSTTLTLRLSKKAKRTLARSRRARLTVKVRFTADGAKTAESATTAIRLR